MEIPVGTERVKQEFVEIHVKREVGHMVGYGQHGCSNDISALHDGIRYSHPQHGEKECLHWFCHVDKISTDKKESRHVECIDHLLGIGMKGFEVNKMERNDKKYEHTLQKVEIGQPGRCTVTVFALLNGCRVKTEPAGSAIAYP